MLKGMLLSKNDICLLRLGRRGETIVFNWGKTLGPIYGIDPMERGIFCQPLF